MFAGSSNWTGAPVTSRPAFALTATERSELLNWACFDALPVVVPYPLLVTEDFWNSPEFQPEDNEQLYRRMVKVLEDIPPGEPVRIEPPEGRQSIHALLLECWFSDKLAEHVARWGSSQMYCYQRARYLFVSHWLAETPEVGLDGLASLVQCAATRGLNKRYALQSLGFDGSRKDDDNVHIEK